MRLSLALALLLAASLGLSGCIRKKAVAAPPPAPLASAVPAPAATTTPGPGPVVPKAKKPKPVVYADPPSSHQEALLHQLDASWARRVDRTRALELPMPDHRHWTRVRFFGVDHFTGFIYGEERDLVTSAFVLKTEPGEVPTSQLCMERFETAGLAKFKRHKGKMTEVLETTQKWKKQPLLVHQADGRLTLLFTRYEFSAAWAAYPAYTDGCLIYATVVFWGDEQELAQRVRDHWVQTGFRRVKPLTKVVPERPE